MKEQIGWSMSRNIGPMRGQIWQAPPGWPTPPPGFVPLPGWEPDTSWPSPPTDWQWWRPAPRTPWQKAGLVATWSAIGLAVLSFGTLAAAQIVDDHLGCGSVDPTDPANYSTITILNDTPDPVQVDQCQGAYCNNDGVGTLLPAGQSLQDHATCRTSLADMNSWRLTSRGRVIGYIAVDLPRNQDGLVFRASNPSPDRRHATASGP